MTARRTQESTPRMVGLSAEPLGPCGERSATAGCHALHDQPHWAAADVSIDGTDHLIHNGRPYANTREVRS
jgi:hypothetical protein